MRTRNQLYGSNIDESIKKTALDLLAKNTMVPHEKIDVDFNEGRITLSGEVEWRYQMKNAERAVSNIFGVKEINNHIKIKSLQNHFSLENLFENFIFARA